MPLALTPGLSLSRVRQTEVHYDLGLPCKGRVPLTAIVEKILLIYVNIYIESKQ